MTAKAGPTLAQIKERARRNYEWLAPKLCSAERRALDGIMEQFESLSDDADNGELSSFMQKCLMKLREAIRAHDHNEYD